MIEGLVFGNPVTLRNGSCINDPSDSNLDREFSVPRRTEVLAEFRATADLGRIGDHEDTQQIIVNQPAADGG